MSVALVLHSHLPWLRQQGTFPVGEEWLFQIWSESYLPLLDVLERLAEDGARDLVTIGITPVLAEQMDDAYLLGEFHGWLGRRLLDLEHTVSRYGGGDGELLRDVWSRHWRRQAALLARFEAREARTGLIAPFRALAEAGVIELLGGPLTHPYLPLLDDEELIRRQLHTGLDVAELRFGTRPRGMWTPECAYRPAGRVSDPTRVPLSPGDVTLPGLETFWAEAGVDHVVLDGPTLARACGAAGRDWSWTGRELWPVGDPLDVLDRPVLVGDSDVAAFGRNLAVSYAVWSPHGGYPGDPWYRDFHRVDMEGGFKSWRVTDRTGWDKAPYDEAAARGRVEAHADDFVGLVGRHLDPRGEDAVVVAAYDTELFGHWWYEGPWWLEAVLRRLSNAPARLRPTTLASSLARHPATRRLHLPESSWGLGKGHDVWANERTAWIWRALREAEARWRVLQPERSASAASAGPRPLWPERSASAASAGPRPLWPERSASAAWRELALLQASDWPFLITHDQSPRYAEERVIGHLARFDALVAEAVHV